MLYDCWKIYSRWFHTINELWVLAIFSGYCRKCNPNALLYILEYILMVTELAYVYTYTMGNFI